MKRQHQHKGIKGVLKGVLTLTFGAALSLCLGTAAYADTASEGDVDIDAATLNAQPVKDTGWKQAASQDSFDTMAKLPSLEKTTVYVNYDPDGWDNYAEVGIKNLGDDDNVIISGGTKSVATADYYPYYYDDKYINIQAKKKGTSKFKVTFKRYNEETYEYETIRTQYLTVKVISVKIACSKMLGYGITVYKGESATITTKGKPTALKATFKSSNKNVATVNSKGKIVAKSYGNAEITVTVGTLEKKIGVSIGPKKGVCAVRWAAKKTPAKYSQPNRMKEGYFDCSSLAGRSYLTQKVYLGSRYWVPTAADQAKWCANNGHVVSWNKIDTDIMRPGDLIFYRYDYAGTNDRYKHIDHVALYAGNGQSVEVRSGVTGAGGPVVMVGRPTQYSTAVNTPASVKAKKATSTSIKLSWKKNANASGYQILRSTEEFGGYKVIKSVSSKNTVSFTNKGLKKGTRYYYKVRAYAKYKGNTCYSSYSKVVSAKL